MRRPYKSTPDSETLATMIHEKLRRAEGGWLSSSFLETTLDVAGSYIRDGVHRLRTMGIPVVSGRNGYRLSDDPKEVEAMTESLRQRASYINEASAGLSLSLKLMETAK
jgi:biotin operon repressor